MSVTRHRARVVWHGNKGDLRAHTVELADQALAASSSPDFGGDASKADPEELFVAALASCHMLWFLDFARRKRLRVLSYEDDPEGTMDGIRFTEVALKPRVEFDRDVAPQLIDELHERAHRACFIANSVACPVRVKPVR